MRSIYDILKDTLHEAKKSAHMSGHNQKSGSISIGLEPWHRLCTAIEDVIKSEEDTSGSDDEL